MNEYLYQHFTKSIKDYSTVASKVVIKNEEIHSELLKVVCSSVDVSARLNILDLGTGTGETMIPLLDSLPNARLTCVDMSERMVEHAKKRLCNYSSRVEFLQDNILNLSEHFGLESFDLVTSSITIHNLTHAEQSRAFSIISQLTKHGGLFVNADYIVYNSPLLAEHTSRIYDEFLRANLAGDELIAWLKHVEHDSPMSLESQKGHLHKAGFGEFKLRWLFCNYAVYEARRNASDRTRIGQR